MKKIFFHKIIVDGALVAIHTRWARAYEEAKIMAWEEPTKKVSLTAWFNTKDFTGVIGSVGV